MQGKRVFITGASSGLGQAMALRFYEAGYDLALVSRRTPAMREWAQRLSLDEDRYALYAADVCDSDSIMAAATACIDQQGLPDVVIACAGLSVGMDSSVRSDLDVMRRVYDTNVFGLVATFHPFLQGMRARNSGILVGIGSVAGIRGLPGHGAYCSSKAAVISYCESLRADFVGTGVMVQTLLPGYVATPLTARNRFSMPFLMQPEDFADRAFKAITSRKSYVVIPWQMGVVAKLLRLMPNRLFDKLLANRPRKRRVGE